MGSGDAQSGVLLTPNRELANHLRVFAEVGKYNKDEKRTDNDEIPLARGRDLTEGMMKFTDLRDMTPSRLVT